MKTAITFVGHDGEPVTSSIFTSAVPRVGDRLVIDEAPGRRRPGAPHGLVTISDYVVTAVAWELEIIDGVPHTWWAIVSVEERP